MVEEADDGVACARRLQGAYQGLQHAIAAKTWAANRRTEPVLEHPPAGRDYPRKNEMKGGRGATRYPNEDVGPAFELHTQPCTAVGDFLDRDCAGKC